MKLNNSTHLCLSIITTGKCNSNCSYCHFYASHNRKEFNKNINFKLFKRYVDYLKFLKEISPNINCRFSGGEPLVMGEELFYLSNYLFNQTDIKPYVMTNGKLLNKELIKKAYNNNISSFVISIENPFDPASNAPDPFEIIKKFNKLKDSEIPIYFGMLVLKNNQFKNIAKIADFFYENTGVIPPLCEVNYIPYQSPTEKELNDLYQNIKYIVKKYNGKTPLSLFPYVIPEYYSGNLKNAEYLTELPLNDDFNILNISNEEMLHKTEEIFEESTFLYDCPIERCDWKDSCKRIKWVWNMENNCLNSNEKLNDYCRFKKTLSNAFYDALVI